MRFLTLTTLLATASAVPTLYQRSPVGNVEPVLITDYSLRKTNGTIQNVNFHIHGFQARNVSCAAGPILSLPSETVTCGASNYRFVLSPLNGTDPNQYALSVYHQTGIASGKYATGTVPTYCVAGGLGSQDLQCNQIRQLGPYKLVLRS
ncbi:hypothetical protein COCMIDRAFT_34751 [Bipolaris oryzae ATCC 44560]|uniref:AA1-like domain-containing protein n=1 Tax=Bipolaris oryzae ATCC 44560 TaxID=930090 RepID=W6ZD04_COCMI|nr:uncharacterized protein COCMIDRAFT_34751 [Bipolaris oryzae ATCC 44560]EUC47683.1 hypothetical protein COCMIDRAFT_34751 [Bipolaris oryzae ATCC 44560]